MTRLTKHEVREQKRLYEQLDFFGAKKKRFVSIYAKKPHIRLKVKGAPVSRHQAKEYWLVELARQQANQQALACGQLFASQQSQMAAMGARGLANSQFGYAGGLGLGQRTAGLGMLGAAYGMQLNHLTDVF
jgi:hypothetical protein